MTIKIRWGHSPDPDDAFMFYGFVCGAVRPAGYELIEIIEDIESLNRRALNAELEVTALSAHAYGYVSRRYYVLSSGSSMGYGYGPILVARTPLHIEDLKGKLIGIPGRLTTAYLLLRLALGEVKVAEMNFQYILDAVVRGEVDAGLIIHEGQLTYSSLNLVNILDLGSWWDGESGKLPLPLGLNAVRRDLGRDFARRFDELLKESIKYGIAKKDEALNYAARYAHGAPRHLIEKFVFMYVNDLTLNMGDNGRRALQFLYKRAAEKGIMKSLDIQLI